MSLLPKEELLARQLAEIEDTIRTMPPLTGILHNSPENEAWFGRASAAIVSWDSSSSPIIRLFIGQIASGDLPTAIGALRQFKMLLHQARHALIVQMPGTGGVSIPHGMVFDYFDEIRKVIQLAKGLAVRRSIPRRRFCVPLFASRRSGCGDPSSCTREASNAAPSRGCIR